MTRNLREPSIQVGEQVFDTAHRVQFRQDGAPLVDRPRVESGELPFFKPRAELIERRFQVFRRVCSRGCLSGRCVEAVRAAKELSD